MAISQTWNDTILFRTHLSFSPVHWQTLSDTSTYTQQLAQQLFAPDNNSDTSKSSSLLTLADCPILQKTSQLGVSLQSKDTRHAWSLALSHSRPRPYQLQVSLMPAIIGGGSSKNQKRSMRWTSTCSVVNVWNVLTNYRTTPNHTSMTLLGSLTGFQWVWTAPKDEALPLSQLRVGWCRTDSNSNSSAWTWVLSLTTRGDFTLTIPLVVAAGIGIDPFYHPLHALYLGAIGWLVQEFTVSLTSQMTNASNAAASKKSKALHHYDRERRKHLRQDAENQQVLMKFQAHRRKTSEQLVNGLVVNVAVYYTAKEQLDVTVPLQFWVSDSSLNMPATSKSQLLGFYDMSTEKKHHDGTHKGDWWISGFWRKETPVSKPARSVPKLSVEYTYAGASYQLTIDDHEELVLPSDRARLIRPAEEVNE
jgi:hypothetical protein